VLQIQDGKGKSDITFLNLQRYNNSDLSKAKKELRPFCSFQQEGRSCSHINQ